MRRSSGLTLIEILTLVVALVVIVAVAIPLWRTHELREQRQRAIQVLGEVLLELPGPNLLESIAFGLKAGIELFLDRLERLVRYHDRDRSRRML